MCPADRCAERQAWGQEGQVKGSASMTHLSPVWLSSWCCFLSGTKHIPFTSCLALLTRL